MVNSPCCNSVAGHQIATNFCTCHDSTAVVPCTKFCSDHCIRIELRVKRNFHRIWIAIEKPLVKRGPDNQWAMHYPCSLVFEILTSVHTYAGVAMERLMVHAPNLIFHQLMRWLFLDNGNVYLDFLSFLDIEMAGSMKSILVECWNLPLIVNTMAMDYLISQGASISTKMVLA